MPTLPEKRPPGPRAGPDRGGPSAPARHAYHRRQELCYRLLAPFYDRLVSPRVREAIEAGVGLLGDLGGLEALDVGTGTGNLALALARAGARVTAVDLSPSLLATARRKAAAWQITVLPMDASSLAFPDRRFDYACASMVLHEMPDRVRDRALGEMARVSSNGLLLIDYRRPGPRSWGVAVVEWLEGSSYRSYLEYPLEARLRGHGLRIARTQYVGQLEALLALRHPLQ